MAEKEQAKQMQQKKNAESIVRLAGKDINGGYPIMKALNQVKGIGLNMARNLSLVADSKLGIKQNTTIGSLNEEQMEKLEGIIKDPAKFGIPSFLFNKQREPESNKDMHLVGTDLIVKVKQEIEAEIKKQSYRGFRHQYGQRVRGQRTRSTGRSGDTIGVMKSKLAPAVAPKAADSKPAKK